MGTLCQESASVSARLIAEGIAPAELNAQAAEVWKRFDTARREILTAEQIGRLLLLEEHLDGGAPTLEADHVHE
jgi:hypothetical protein